MKIREPTTVTDLVVLILYLTGIVFAGYIAGYIFVWACFMLWKATL